MIIISLISLEPMIKIKIRIKTMKNRVAEWTRI
jgi:hypothetical protein